MKKTTNKYLYVFTRKDSRQISLNGTPHDCCLIPDNCYKCDRRQLRFCITDFQKKNDTYLKSIGIQLSKAQLTDLYLNHLDKYIINNLIEEKIYPWNDLNPIENKVIIRILKMVLNS